jgi:hypothetical protein
MFSTTVPVSNDTIIGNINPYLRQNPDTNSWEINLRVDPSVEQDDWVPIGPYLHTTFANDVPGTPMPTIGRLIAIIVSATRNEIAWREKHDTIRSQALDAIEMIGDRLIQESERRGWCSEFDEIIDEVNANMPGPFELPTREREYNVCWSETYTVTVHRSTTVTARNEEQACEAACELYSGEADEYEMREALSAGNYEFSDDNSDYEAEES